MKTSYRRILVATLGTLAALAFAAVGSGAALAADLHAVGTSYAQGGNGGGGNGGNGGGGSGGSGGSGQGTATPELPSGVLFGIGLIPLGAGLFLIARRRRVHA